MGSYYTPGRNSRCFSPTATEPFALSRSKIDLFLKCARCFYLDRRLGIGQPPGFPFTLNNAVDTLLKKEFDAHRAKGEPHPMMVASGIDAIPFQHAKLEEWRDARRAGIRCLHEASNLVLHGGIDDVWVNPQGELILVDYKATSKTSPVTLDADWQISYKRQIEMYQWLFRRNGFIVSNTGVFVYCNGDTSKEGLFGRLEFDIKILTYEGNDSWIERALLDARECLMKNTWPKMAEDCDYCRYRKAIKVITPST
ncbi:MAG: PD-(D/E)XK nuclease family protein [Deltaproteobacteria bacterium]|nr:PD-(D/E)XK nuclease family protein [Deltaproteobacteria bacterium]MBI3294089.1 PD-(D/E)XK nuclease family protein [Deltaproteobacteria bacterium]